MHIHQRCQFYDFRVDFDVFIRGIFMEILLFAGSAKTHQLGPTLHFEERKVKKQAVCILD